MTAHQQLQGWPRAKALGDIGRHLAAAHNDHGQVNVILYDWQRDLLADELVGIEAIEAVRLSNLILAPPSHSGRSGSDG